MIAVGWIFRADLEEAEAECVQLFENAWERFPEHVQAACINMMFNMGLGRFAKFKATIAHLRAGDFEHAAAEALDSLWAAQVGPRAKRVTELMRGNDVY
jgi:lysozyme